MKFKKPGFWQKKESFISLILLPFSFFLLMLIWFKKKISNEKKFNLPVLCIGNIYIGGTGKTPLSIFIAKELQKIEKKPVIIKKFYDEHNDEHLLIKKNNIPLITKKNRKDAILSADNKFDLVILDDGFQDFKIKKNMSVLCFHSNQLIGNGRLFPSGPLRESLNALQRAEMVLINGKKNVNFENKLYGINQKLKIFYSRYNLINIQKYKDKNILAFAGIGNADNFFDLLRSNNLKVKHSISFPDHYNFKKNEIIKIVEKAKNTDCTILTTEKDFLRIEKYNFSEINSCPVELEILEKEKFIKSIKAVYDKSY